MIDAAVEAGTSNAGVAVAADVERSANQTSFMSPALYTTCLAS